MTTLQRNESLPLLLKILLRLGACLFLGLLFIPIVIVNDLTFNLPMAWLSTISIIILPLLAVFLPVLIMRCGLPSVARPLFNLYASTAFTEKERSMWIFGLGACYLLEKKYEQVIDTLTPLLTAKLPSWSRAETHRLLAATYLLLNRSPEIMGSLAIQGRSLNPKLVVLYVHEGAANFQLGKYQEALRTLKQAIPNSHKFRPNTRAYLWFYLGSTYHQLGDLAQAKAYLERALSNGTPQELKERAARLLAELK